jgi:hypothetical protein
LHIHRYSAAICLLARLRTFSDSDATAVLVQFVLEPLYKIFSVVLSEERPAIEAMLYTFGVKLKPSAYGQDIKPLLQAVCGVVFGNAAGLTDMMLAHVPSTKRAARSKIERLYTGPQVRFSHQLCMAFGFARSPAFTPCGFAGTCIV